MKRLVGTLLLLVAPVAAARADGQSVAPQEFKSVHLYVLDKGQVREISVVVRLEADRMVIAPVKRDPATADPTVDLRYGDIGSVEVTFATSPRGSSRTHWLRILAKNQRTFVMRLSATRSDAIVAELRKRAGIAIAGVACGALCALAYGAPSRGWLDLNRVAGHFAQDQKTYRSRTFEGEVERTTALTYPAQVSTATTGLAAGVRLLSSLALGLNVSRFHQTGEVVADHNNFFLGSTQSRRERSVDVSAVFLVSTPDAWRVRFFGGPTWFQASQGVTVTSQSTIAAIVDGELVRLLVDPLTSTTLELRGSTWGLHGGADVAFFFSRFAGVGALMLVNHGTVEAEAPVLGQRIKLRTGGMMAGVGLRVRF